jgi:hypothetical protein
MRRRTHLFWNTTEARPRALWRIVAHILMPRIIPLEEVTSALLPVQGSLPALLVSNGIFLVLVWGSVWLVACGPNISRRPDSWGQSAATTRWQPAPFRAPKESCA